MSDPFIGEIRPWACNFAPRGWAMCQGQMMQIVQNQALFALIGNRYGGDGRTTFALPNLTNKIPIHMGSGPGLTSRVIASSGGTTQEALSLAQIPAHNHSINAVDAVSSINDPTNNLIGKASYKVARDTFYPNCFTTTLPNQPVPTMNQNALTPVGNGLPHDNRQPFLTLNYCIAVQGIFPCRQ